MPFVVRPVDERAQAGAAVGQPGPRISLRATVFALVSTGVVQAVRLDVDDLDW